jgi:hypothetical protein
MSHLGRQRFVFANAPHLQYLLGASVPGEAFLRCCCASVIGLALSTRALALPLVPTMDCAPGRADTGAVHANAASTAKDRKISLRTRFIMFLSALIGARRDCVPARAPR